MNQLLESNHGKKIEVNGVEFVLPVDINVEVKVEYSPFKPASYSNTEHSFDLGQNITQIADGVYLRHYYNHSNAPYTVRDERFNEETGEWEMDEWQEWENLKVDEYYLVIVQPEVVGRSVNEFTPYEQAQYRLASLVRSILGKEMTQGWKIHLVSELPQIEYRSASTPANTSNVSWGGQLLSDSVVLKTVDGWTGSRDDTQRDLYVLRSEWSALDNRSEEVIVRKPELATIFVEAAMNGTTPDDLWEVELPAGTRYNANTDNFGVSAGVTDKVMTVREIMNLAQLIVIPENVIGSRWRRVVTPYGVVYREDYASNWQRGTHYGFVPNEALLKQVAQIEVTEFQRGERTLDKMRQEILSAEVFSADGMLVKWTEKKPNYPYKLQLLDARGGGKLLEYLVWDELRKALPEGGYAILKTKYTGTLKLTKESLEACNEA